MSLADSVVKLLSPSSSRHANQGPQPRPVCTWSAYAPQSGPSKSPFPRCYHALSTTATAAGELFLFGGFIHTTSSDDLYLISTRDASTTLLETSGEVPIPRGGHGAVLTSTNLLIWGGKKDYFNQDGPLNDSLHLLNLGSLYLLMSRPTPTHQSVLCSSISRMDPHHGQWSWAAGSFPPYSDNGRFQVLCLWW